MDRGWTEGEVDAVQKWTETVPCWSTSDPPLVHLVRTAGGPQVSGRAVLPVGVHLQCNLSFPEYDVAYCDGIINKGSDNGRQVGGHDAIASCDRLK